jgi:lipopolysaccharide transport system ATP-binding protein
VAEQDVVEVAHVCKQFRIGRNRSLRETVSDAFSRLRGAAAGERRRFDALSDVSFTVAAGEVLGIIGHNGAGKSTLLKLLAGISMPTSGRVTMRVRAAPLIEVGAGLVGDLSGRENIYLNAAILGMRRAEVRRKFDEIVAFAELERFIDTPLKRYSSGMQVRLGFAIATAVAAEVLIVDEVLAVGDIAFQRKCYDRMQQLIQREGRTVLLVSHNVKEIERLSHRVLLLENGRVAALGEPSNVCNLYYERTHAKVLAQGGTDRLARPVEASGEIEVRAIELRDEADQPTDSAIHGRPCAFVLTIFVREPVQGLEIEFGLHTLDSLRLATCTSASSLAVPRLEPGEHRFRCELREMPLVPGVYAVRLHIGIAPANHGVFYGEHLLRFGVRAPERPLPPVARQGFVELDAVWSEDGARQRAGGRPVQTSLAR